MISGIRVFYPDKKPTQRIGIVPNVEVRPSVAGLLAGRDEVSGRSCAPNSRGLGAVESH